MLQQTGRLSSYLCPTNMTHKIFTPKEPVLQQRSIVGWTHYNIVHYPTVIQWYKRWCRRRHVRLQGCSHVCYMGSSSSSSRVFSHSCARFSHLQRRGWE